MPIKWMRSVMLIITYAVFLVLAVIKFDVILDLAGQVLTSCRPLFLGFAIAFILNRPCAFFCRHYERNLGERFKKLGRPLAVLTSYVAMIAIIVALFSFVLPQVVDSIQLFAASVSGYMVNLQAIINKIAEYLDLSSLDLSSLSSYLRSFLEGVLSSVTTAASQVMVVTSSILSMFVTLVLAIVFSIYMLAGREKLLDQGRRLLRAYLPDRHVTWVSDVIRLTAETFTNFVSGQAIEACILGGLCALGTFFIQPDYAALIGVIVGVSALIPVAGAYIGAILSAFLLVMVSPVRAIIFLIFLSILQQIEGNVIYPRVVGTFFIQADYAALIGVIVGVSALIPVAGAYIGAILSAFLLVMVSPVRAIIFLIFLSILQQIEGNVIYPRVVGTSIGLPGIWVLTAVTVGGGLFGLLGVLLSVPVASVLYALLKQDVVRRLRKKEPVKPESKEE